MTTFMVSGNVSRAAKTRIATTSSGQQTMVTDFNVAVNDGIGDRKITTFYKVTLWGQKGGNLAKYLTVGKEVNVSGIPGQEAPWTGEDGQIRAGAMTIRRARVELKGKKSAAEPEIVDEEEVPFEDEEE
jgi:single-stranded DNA-binding protein